MYDRSDTEWLFRYYSGESRDAIAASLFRSSKAIFNRIRSAGLPSRPRGAFWGRTKESWLSRPDIVALREKYRPVDRGHVIGARDGVAYGSHGTRKPAPPPPPYSAYGPLPLDSWKQYR